MRRLFLIIFVAHVVPFKITKLVANSSKILSNKSLSEDLEQKESLLKGYQAKLKKIKADTKQASAFGSNLSTTANLYASLTEIVPKNVRLTSFQLEEKSNILFSGVAKNDQAVVNLMNRFSENDLVNDSKIEALVEFSKKDRIELYKIEGEPAPKIDELPAETISKKFNSRLTLNPIEGENFDDLLVISKLMGNK